MGKSRTLSKDKVYRGRMFPCCVGSGMTVVVNTDKGDVMFSCDSEWGFQISEDFEVVTCLDSEVFNKFIGRKQITYFQTTLFETIENAET